MITTYDTAKALKEAGFDQTLQEGERIYQGSHTDEELLVASPQGTMEAQGGKGGEYVRVPSYTALMDAMKVEGIGYSNGTWMVTSGGTTEKSGFSLEDALMTLWLTLNLKQ